MEIKEIMQGAAAALGLKKGSKEELKEMDFRRLLEEANMNVKGDHRTVSSPPVNEASQDLICAPSFISGLNGQLAPGDAAQIRSQGIQTFENTLKILEQYGEAIGNPGIPLKRIDPLVRSLDQELENLNRLSEQLSPSDPLKKIMTEAGIVSAMEIEKFRRGEYV